MLQNLIFSIRIKFGANPFKNGRVIAV